MTAPKLQQDANSNKTIEALLLKAFPKVPTTLLTCSWAHHGTTYGFSFACSIFGTM